MIRLHDALSRSMAAALLGVLASCASTGPEIAGPRGDPIVLQAATAGRLAYQQGDFALAQKLYGRALTRARAIDDAGLAADAAYNLAMSEIGLGSYDAAEPLLRQARYDAVRAGSGTGDIQLLRAKVAYLRARPAEALAMTEDVIGSAAAGSLGIQARILRGQIRGDAGDSNAARLELQAAEKLGTAGPASAPTIAADLAKLKGTIARIDGQTGDAADFFDTEAEQLRVAHRYRDMSHALVRAAAAYLAAGRPALAADRYFLAARSLYGHGETKAAAAFLADSVSAADKAGDEEARLRARTILEEIRRRRVP